MQISNNNISFKANISRLKPVAALFDKDGVVINTIEAQFKTWDAFHQRHKLPFSREIFGRDFLAGPNEWHMKRLFKGITDEKAAQLAVERENIFKEISKTEGTPVLPGFVPFVKDLRNHTDQIGIVTSSMPDHVQRTMGMLEDAGLRNPESYFKTIITGAKKPHPQGYIDGMKGLGALPEHSAVFEDSFPGMVSARAANIPNVVALATSHSPAQLKAMHEAGLVKHVMPDFTDFSAKRFLELTGH